MDISAVLLSGYRIPKIFPRNTRAVHARFNTFVRLVLLAAWILDSSVSLWAAYRSDPDYLIDSWEVQQGMPDNSATAIVQTPDGYLWIGTFNGLVQFDGVDFRVYDPASIPALPSAGIVNLYLDANARLWISTLKGLATRQNDHWITYTTEQGWTGDFARTFAENDG